MVALLRKDKVRKKSVMRSMPLFLTVLFGVFVTFLSIEIVLRIGSIIVTDINKQHIDKGEYNILCAGDSFTYGTGVSMDESYPAHLQLILNREFGPGFMRVYNKGTPGHNSSQSRDELLLQLKNTHAKILIILAGHNNYWNFNDLHLEGVNPAFAIRAERLLARLRVYRLLKILVANLSEKINNSRDLNDDILSRYFEFQESQQRTDKIQAEMRRYQQYLSGHPQDIYPYLKLAALHRDMGEEDRARQLIDRAYKIDPLVSEQLLKQQGEIEKFHREQDFNQKKGFKHLFQAILKRAGMPRAKAAFKRYLDFQQAIVEDVLRQDLAWMVEAARRRGVKVIISSYPVKKRANRILHEMSAHLKVPFVDQDAAFQALKRETPCSDSDYFALDGHCNEAGYRKMAENIAGVLRKLV